MKKGLNDHQKMATAGYMINGEEGEKWAGKSVLPYLAGAGDFAIAETFNNQIDEYYETPEISKYTIMTCGVSTFSLLDKDPSSNSLMEGACLLGAYQ